MTKLANVTRYFVIFHLRSICRLTLGITQRASWIESVAYIALKNHFSNYIVHTRILLSLSISNFILHVPYLGEHRITRINWCVHIHAVLGHGKIVRYSSCCTEWPGQPDTLNVRRHTIARLPPFRAPRPMFPFRVPPNGYFILLMPTKSCRTD